MSKAGIVEDWDLTHPGFSGSGGSRPKPPSAGGGADDLRAAYTQHMRACPNSKLTYEQFVEVLKFETGDSALCFPKLTDGKLEFSYDL